ncbi:SIMPL domain-containing protein [Candidatus Kaiserbacteria bacterium]|nr:SIMPL domain-containing protein [Candidatus Kaiserbacteria bacterium]
MNWRDRFTSSDWALIASAGILAVGLAVTGAIGGDAFYRVRALSNTLSVTGSATATSTADVAKWRVTVNRLTTEESLAPTQSKVSADSQSVVDFFSRAGIPQEKISVSPVYVDREYSNDNVRRYNVRQEVSIESGDVRLVEKLSRDITSLISRGILISVQSPEYFISNLPAIRVSLIGKAVSDAKARAVEIAKSTGQNVGPLQSASGGVVQVMAPNSVEVSDYGSYDTSTIDKQVMVTARATFLVQ